MTRNSKLSKNVGSYFREYCNASSIHGIRYFGERRTYFERGWWFVVFVVCLSACGYFISLVYNKWENSPVIVSFSTKEKPIYEIPFPAVTICPETKSFREYYKHSKVVEKLLHKENLTLSEYQNASYMSLICDFNVRKQLRKYHKSGFDSFNNYYYQVNDFFKFLYDVMPNRSDILLGCSWMNEYYNCDDLFRPIITDEGICYTFNMLDHKEIYKNNVLIPNVTLFDSKIAHNVTWSLDEEYKDNDGVDTYPKRALLSGIKDSLQLFLVDFSEYTDPYCKLSKGFKVSLHTSMRIPRPSQQHFRVPLKEEVLVAVQPTMITTSATVRDFKPEKRKCYFQTDKPLKYFKKYSQLNCNLECLTNFTISCCGCVNFFMPRENGSKICGTFKYMCMVEAEKSLQQGHLSSKLENRPKKNRTQGPSCIENIKQRDDCNCLPLCSDLSYNVEISSSQWEWKDYLHAMNFTPPEEKLGAWWIIVFVVCLSVCAYFITLIYKKWDDSPVIVSLSNKETPIYKIPFPAVTICPETKSVKKYYNHLEAVRKLRNNEEMTLKEFKYFSYRNLICDINSSDLFLLKYADLHSNFPFDNWKYEDNDFFEFLHEVTPNRSDIFLGCRWLNLDWDCDDLFRTVITDEGICYTFNMLEHTDLYKNNVFSPNVTFFDPRVAYNVNWSLDEGYNKNDDEATYPRRALLSGIKSGLEVLLADVPVDHGDSCTGSLQGFKVSLHTPTRIPRPSQEHIRVPVNEMALTAVQPVMITSSETVKGFEPYKRDCYLHNEKPLKYFKKYSQQNCNLECLTNFTYYRCKCVNFYMPRENDTSICGVLAKNCMTSAERLHSLWELRRQLDYYNKRKSVLEYTEEVPPKCNCLPVCTDLSYNVETSSSQWEFKNDFNAMSAINAINNSLPVKEKGRSLSKLIIYFKNTQFVTTRRHELYGPTDFLGNFGGLLGLFTGFSILSLMEIIYFLTVRIICNIRLYRNWSGCEED